MHPANESRKTSPDDIQIHISLMASSTWSRSPLSVLICGLDAVQSTSNDTHCHGSSSVDFAPMLPIQIHLDTTVTTKMSRTSTYVAYPVPSYEGRLNFNVGDGVHFCAMRKK